MRVRVRLGAEPSRGIIAMVGYSALGHVLVLALMIFAPRVIPRRPPPPLLLTAQIVSLPSAGPPAPAAPAAVPTPTERADQAARAARKERKPEPIPPEPDAPKPPRRKSPTREKKPPPPAPAAPKEEPAAGAGPQPAGPLAQGIGLGAGGDDGAAGIPSITSASFPYQYYRTTMMNLIRARWHRPLTPGLTESLRCAVSFVISKEGQIGDVAISVPSGLDALDGSAMRAVLDTGRLPPLPYQYVSPSVRAELIFELTPD